jgi:hypothetical protein
MNNDIRIDTVKKFWETAGEEDPFWGVDTKDSLRAAVAGEEDIRAFYISGKVPFEEICTICDRFNISFADSNVMDFGSGVGRIGIHMIPECEVLYCIDISKSYLSRVSTEFDHRGYSNYKLVEYDQFFTYNFTNVDLIYSYITLQHNHPEVILDIVSRMCKILNSGGIGIVDIPYHIPNWRYVPRTVGYDDDNNLFGMQMNKVDISTMDSVIHSNKCEVVAHDLRERNPDSSIMTCVYTFIKK